MNNLTSDECQALLAIISNARITGADARLVVRLLDKLQNIIDQQSPDPDDYRNPGGTE